MDITTGASAIVTGGASGLGMATARALAAAGARVVIVDLPGSEGADAAASLGADHRFAPADVTDPAAVQGAVAVASQLGPLRVVVHCAGIAPAAKVLGRHGAAVIDEFERVVRVDLLGTFTVLRTAAAAMAETERLAGADAGDGARGVIVTTASVAAFDGQIGQAAYAAAKGGVHAMTLPIARELAEHGIRVVSIAPGIMATPLLEGLPIAAQESLAAQVPHPARPGKPEEFAALVRHIVDNDYLNGTTIRLDGALRMGSR